jgi:hypothetical protein
MSSGRLAEVVDKNAKLSAQCAVHRSQLVQLEKK